MSGRADVPQRFASERLTLNARTAVGLSYVALCMPQLRVAVRRSEWDDGDPSCGAKDGVGSPHS